MNKVEEGTVRKNAQARRPMIVATAVAATFMAGMDSTIVNLAVPVLKSAYHADIALVQWVVTAYSLAMAVFTPLAAFLANRFGRKRPFVVAVGLFTAGSLLCALSTSLGMLIAARVLQAIGGSALLALAMMIALSAFPSGQRGRAMAWFGVPSMIAPAAGPVVGGYLMSIATWRAAFLINVPIGLAGIVMAASFLKDSEEQPAHDASFDVVGFLLIGAASAGVTLGVSESAIAGWGSALTQGSLASGVAFLGAFIFRSLGRLRRGGETIVDLHLFRHRSFWSGALALAVVIFAMFGPLLLVPLYLLSVRDVGVFHAGLIMSWNALAAMVAAFIGGRLVDRFGGRAVVLPGITVFALDALLFTGLSLHTPLSVVAMLLFLRGIGSGLTTQPLVAASLREVTGPSETAHASTLFGVLRNLVGGAGVAVLVTFVQVRARTYAAALSHHGLAAALLARMSLMRAVDDAFWLSFFLLCSAAVIVLVVLPKRARGNPADDARST